MGQEGVTCNGFKSNDNSVHDKQQHLTVEPFNINSNKHRWKQQSSEKGYAWAPAEATFSTSWLRVLQIPKKKKKEREK